MSHLNQVAVKIDEEEPQPATGCGPADMDQEQHYRASFYGLLAGLLRNTPDRKMLAEVAELAAIEPSKAELTTAMSMLGLAASSCSAESVNDEFHDLFIGLGRGELMPYGSWYQTGFLMEKPLGHLRDDLALLGYQRTEQVYEPEDHVAALCEVMMLMISEATEISTQTQFFNRHMADWIEQFFKDLSEAQAAVFFRAVGRFGLAFIDFEKRYLSLQV